VRYWLLTTEYPPFYGGGISTYSDQTARMLSDAGHDVTVFLPQYDAVTPKELAGSKIKLIRFNPLSSSTRHFLGHEANLSFAFAEAVISQIQKEGKPDFIETQEYLGIGYYLLQKKHLGYPELVNIPVVVTLHAPTFLYLDYNQVPLYKHPNFWTGEMERFCIRAADIRISPSAYLPESIRNRMELSDIEVHVLPNPFEADYVSQPVPEFQDQEVVFFGKIIPQKGCIELLKYFHDMWEEGSKVPLRMIGGGRHLFHPINSDLVTYLKAKYKKHIDAGLLRMEGEIKPEELFEKLKRAQLILIPSIVDNLPYTVLEAMAAGKVVLASKQGGQSEIITHEKDGFLFDHAIPGSFKKELGNILSLSKETIQDIGSHAKQTIKQNYNHRVILTKKLALLKSFAEQKPTNHFPLIRPPQKTPSYAYSGEKGLLSVVIPYFNMGAFVEETVNSILTSGIENLELILVNDGSTDPLSLSKLSQFRDNQRIRIIHKKNEGLSLARNTGAAEARGEYLAFLDPDDKVEPGYYEKALSVLSAKENISFVGCWASYFGDSTGTWPAFNPEPPYVLLHNCLNTSALVYKKSHFLAAGLNDPGMLYGMEDYESLIAMIAKGYRGVAIPEPLWKYRIRKNSMARAFTTNSQLFLYKRIAEKHSQLYADFATPLFLLLNSNGPSLNIDNPTLNRGIYSKFGLSGMGSKVVSLAKRNRYLRPFLLGIYKMIAK
jgi:glycosyltransferase involved in cell wall biosynthesis